MGLMLVLFGGGSRFPPQTVIAVDAHPVGAGGGGIGRVEWFRPNE